MDNMKQSPPRLAQLFLERCLRDEDRIHRLGDFEEVFKTIKELRGLRQAYSWYWGQVLRSAPKMINNSILWSIEMFKNYIKLALRNFRKFKGYTFINILGLSLSIACALLIFMYVHQEITYDNFHTDRDRVFRVVEEIQKKGSVSIFAPIGWPVIPTLQDKYPQIEAAVRVSTFVSARLIRHENKMFFEEKFMFAGPQLFDVLTFRFIEGDPQRALERPHTFVITERMAKKYFGHTHVLGNIMSVNSQDYEVTGIVEDCPANTHLKYDFIASLQTIYNEDNFSNWYGTECYSYIKLAPNVDPLSFGAQIQDLADEYVGETLRKWGNQYLYHLQPVKNIHLHSKLLYEIEPPGNSLTLSLFFGIGLLILLVATMNFINLATARSIHRAKEVGIRKVIGGQKKQLIFQFLGESLFLAFGAVILGLGLVALFHTQFNNMAGTSFTLSSLKQWSVVFLLLGMVFFVGVGAGIYPAFSLSSFQPSATLQGFRARGKRSSNLRKFLVVFQFAISILLIIGTIIIQRQIDHMKNEHPGFSVEQKLVIPFRGGAVLGDNYESVKNVFLGHATVTGATTSSSIPGRSTSSFSIRIIGEREDLSFSMYHMYIDPDFLEEYEIKMAAGRHHQKERRTDLSMGRDVGGFVINEAAVRTFGWSTPGEAIGKELKTGLGGRIGPIIGVTQNFHYKGLQIQVEPLIMEWIPNMFRVLTLTLDTSDLGQTLEFVKDKWGEVYPGIPYEGFFLDQDFEKQYLSEVRMGKIVFFFSLMGIFIACLGLVGLGSFMATQKTKEIGIRKVLGASVSGIVFILSKEFVKWVVLANLLAWPTAYFVMRIWLNNFAYKAVVGLWIFVFAGMLALAAALLTVSYQSIKSALSDPVKSLRYE
ncbi:ABC transporter permease [Acidobacteriota bacterium]